MNVLHIFNEINYSGAETMYLNANSIFKQHNVKMFAFNTGPKLGSFVDEFIASEIEVTYMPIPDRKTFYAWYQYFRKYIDFVKRNNIAIIHIHRNSHLWFFAFVGYIAGVRTIRTVHNVFRNRSITLPKAILERLIAREFLGVTFQTIGKSVFENELLYYKNNSVRINNWYNENLFYPAKDLYEKNNKRAALQIDIEDFVIISTGNCSNIKNHSDILKALALVKNDIKFKYIHIGTGEDEAYEKELAAQLEIDKDIYFLGHKSNIRDYLIASDVFVMSSKHEGLSIAALEAMACGLPSILYDVPGLKDLINNDDNGYLITPSYEELAKKLLIYYNNPVILKNKGNKALKYVQKHFSININTQKIIQLYDKKIDINGK